MDLEPVTGGVVDLRDDRRGLTWRTEVSPFLLGRCPVTEREYRSSGGLLPATNLSWFDAVDWCNRASVAAGFTPVYTRDGDDVVCDWSADGYRLPTDAEWQHACKAGSTGYRYGELDEIAWYADNSGERTHEVGGKRPNAWGLHDMLGNVWEWCWDRYDPHTYGSYRIFRGGGWAEPARGCGATVRRRSHPTFAIDDLGFRVARTTG
ncbi:formylglycine-generating enzyme family protein [Amycolatopsis suaedae]|uniref:Formylglycine-generating enzyme family protein n=1 Tax=Amycolatopsis suaedae TaxID=2510978 RepID=A0A4V2EM53_9PSEU|nr:formylglycine-generating enzyme family protein [Amycolatopsis suaedae]RZQ63865.1 formylglycine-generating enzyme family protein [Amycolatopsis suaedae]